MADIDISITDPQYAQFQTLISGLQAKLDPLVPLLARAMEQDVGREKLKAYIKANPVECRLLVLTNQLANYLDSFRDQINWGND